MSLPVQFKNRQHWYLGAHLRWGLAFPWCPQPYRVADVEALLNRRCPCTCKLFLFEKKESGLCSHVFNTPENDRLKWLRGKLAGAESPVEVKPIPIRF